MASSSHRAESSPSSLRDGHNRPYDRHHLIANSSSSISIDSEEKWDDDGVYHGREKDDAIELEALNRRRDDENDDDDNDGAHDCTSSLSSPKALYTVHEEKAIVRKFDRHLVLLIALMYLLAFLDRSNIGNARIAGMDVDLQTSPPREDWYTWAIQAFYVSYIGFEWMSLLWHVIPPHIYASMLVLSWGVVASLQAVAPSYPFLIVLRALLGAGEAGFTGIPLYLCMFFKRDELAFRTAIFVSAAPLATSFASTLAWLILKVGEASPITPWRLLFLVEGFPSVIVAVIAWRIVPDSPHTASYLTSHEKRIARLRLTTQHQSHSSTVTGHWLKIREVLAVCTDPIAIIPAIMFFLTNMAYSSLPVFLPTILEESMGHDRLRAQALSAPPYLVSFFFVLATAKLSDSMRSRSAFLVPFALASALGYATLALSEHVLRLEPASALRYLAVYPAAAGFFCVAVLIVVWNVNNQPSRSRRGAGFAMMQIVGQCGPLLGARLYPRSQSPFYTQGMAVCATAMLGVAALALLQRWVLVRRNRALDARRGYRDHGGRGGDVPGADAGFRFMV
ncbi:hypothetical protein MCOR27_005206 [Pyricularia oryzae]|uniref:MFS general substrate transporter n=1 Tax=Pyricularia grisea TaxID=148305 RepID=A0ABQ8NYH8_PYRGI|nr:hypothetical protein MCOR01_000762 [Pyricularia oryzae]KAI6303006.1 hypothetical protein MCOR33_001782 [Pyricularia grisea]KAH9428476.1 hypothetical protein MCOR02_011026 [Pyricularia oryzae]KAI6259937.1 hypothetical protein MCOR19_003761 [Pyricularia oryzae]KAI6276036.1 hypothetical protein MCOR26_005781 [Pyricularia oryzae]